MINPLTLVSESQRFGGIVENRAWKSSVRFKSEAPDIFPVESVYLTIGNRTGNRLSWFCTNAQISKFLGTLSLLLKEI